MLQKLVCRCVYYNSIINKISEYKHKSISLLQNEILPFRWTEHMITEVKHSQKRKESPIPQEKTDMHYTSHDPEKNIY